MPIQRPLLAPNQIFELAKLVDRVIKHDYAKSQTPKFAKFTNDEGKEFWEQKLARLINYNSYLPSYEELEDKHCEILETLIDYYSSNLRS